MGSFEFEAFNDEDNEDKKAINRYGKKLPGLVQVQ